MRKTSDVGIALIKRFEGCRLIAYYCAAGKLTIGYGHTSGVYAGQVITQAQAESYLKADLAKYETKVNKYDAKYKWNQNEFDALVSFAFNIGSIDQLTANGTRTKETIANKITKYNTANGKELQGLTARRKAEQELFLKRVLDTETELESTAGLSSEQIKANIIIVQKWINKSYGDYLKECKSTDYSLLKEDGKIGNKTRAGLTVVLQTYLNVVYSTKLKVDGDYGNKTNEAVRKYLLVKLGTDSVASKIVQGILYCYGYNPQTFGNVFNEDCVRALKQCQKDKNLNSDGKAGVIFFSTFLKQR